jgi:hypothetical protein
MQARSNNNSIVVVSAVLAPQHAGTQAKLRYGVAPQQRNTCTQSPSLYFLIHISTNLITKEINQISHQPMSIFYAKFIKKKICYRKWQH